MTRIGGPSGHQYISHTPSGEPKEVSLDALPAEPSHIRQRPIPLVEIAKFIFPESISSAEIASNPHVKKEVEALLALVTLHGLKDGISGSP